jgi:hypothetical protein
VPIRRGVALLADVEGSYPGRREEKVIRITDAGTGFHTSEMAAPDRA